MRSLWLIAKREYLATVRTKAFIISLIILPILWGGGFVASTLLEDQVDVKDRRIVLLDFTGRLSETILMAAEERNATSIHNANGEKIAPAYLFETKDTQEKPIDQLRLEYSDQVRNNELFGFVEIGSGVLKPETAHPDASISLYSKNPAMDDMRGWLRNIINSKVREIHLQALGLDPTELAYVFKRHAVDGMKLVELDKSGEVSEAERASEIESYGVPFGFLFLMYVLTMMGATPLLSSVMEEKNQHIAETLLSSASPFQFMFGKVVGCVAVSLTSSSIYVAGVVALLARLEVLSMIPMYLLPWLFIYIILITLMIGSMMAAIGAACSDLKEAQNYMFPALLPVLVPLVLGFVVIREPSSGFSTFVSLIPPFTPMLMMVRQSIPGGSEIWQIILGLLGSGLFTLFVIWVGSRIFRVGILLKGKAPGFSTLVKWAIKG
ncbi:MAG: ABC transporter permease [Verrucomicrobiota bacterium]